MTFQMRVRGENATGIMTKHISFEKTDRPILILIATIK